MKSMKKEYGAEKAKKVFYASENAGKITNVHKTSAKSAASRNGF